MATKFAESVIIRLCKQPRSFEFLSKSLHGLDPVETLTLLNEMQNAGYLVQMEERWVVKQVPIAENLSLYPVEHTFFLEKYMGYFGFLKTPHPLDFEWRNSTESLNRLMARIQRFVEPDDPMLFLGMPTLFATAIAKDISNSVTLIERNKPILNGLQSVITDSRRFKIIDADIFLLDPKLIAPHFCVVMDPPWYAPHFSQFMWLAANSIPIGGFVAISLPPINTRPTILNERTKLFSFCEQLGLCLEILEPQQLHYAMPFFEFNALRSAGVSSILPFWRKGDFVLFRKVNDSTQLRPKNELSVEKWVEREYKSVRIRIKMTTEELKDRKNELEIESLVSGDILPSVSSRTPIRAQANVWSSGNRIYKVNNPEAFLSCVDVALNGRPESDNERLTFEFLQLIAKLEKKEFDNYLDWIYYEMERQTD